MPRRAASTRTIDPERPPEPKQDVPAFDGEMRLASKLSWVMGQVGYIEKRGFNAHFKYNFVREADLKSHIAPLLSKLHIFLLADVINHERVGTTTILTVRWTFIDGETGERLAGTSVGYGDDRGDKGANKAMTAALKFFLIPTFLVVSGDDAEADDRTEQRADQMSNDRPPQVQASTAQQPRRGGHSEEGTSLQVQRISELSRSLDLGSEGVAEVVERVLGVKITLPEGEKSVQAGALARALLQMTADDLGKVVQNLRQQFETIEAASKEEEDDLPEVPEGERSLDDLGLGY